MFFANWKTLEFLGRIMTQILVSKSDSDLLSHSIALHIMNRTSQRVRELRVICQDERIVLSGIAPSYHVIQLALQAVTEVIRSLGQVAIEPQFAIARSV